MSTTIDSKVVEMRFDNKQFEQGISQSTASLEKLKSSLKFDGVVDNAALNSISKGVDYLASRFTALGQILMGVKMQAAAMVKSLTIDQIGAGWDKYNSIIASTQTIMSATAKNWTDNKNDLKDQNKQMAFVTEQLDKLNRFTDETSAKLTDMTNNIGKFTSAGVKLDTATDAMMGIATWGYKSGASVEQMSRAMYNLSQAMGMGALRVQDWMSIENANMATEEFKDTCIKTGLELGKLKKGANGAVYATDKFGKKIQVTTENFRSTLASGWLDSKVITATLKKYGDFASEILKISEDLDAQVTPMMRDIQDVKNGTLDLANAAQVAKRAHDAGTDDVEAYTEALKKLSATQYDLGFSAFKASQEAKTFAEAIDYTKDAVSTNWMNTFKTIVGDYLEAKELWTAVTEEMYDVFIYDLERQNLILKKWGEGGGREALLEGIANAWHNIKTLIETIKDAFRNIFPPATENTLLSLTDGFKAFTYVLKFTESQTERIQTLFESFFRGVKHITDGVKNFWDVVVGSIRDNNLAPKDFFDENGIFNGIHQLIQEFTNFTYAFKLTKSSAEKFKPLLDSIFNLINTIGASAKNTLLALSKAFRKVFGDSEFELLDSIAGVINNISKAFSVTGKRAEQVQKIFEAFFAIIDVGKMLLEAILGPIFGLTDGATDLTDAIFAIAEGISTVIIGIRNWLKEHDTWKKVIAWVINTIRLIPTALNQLSLKVFGKDVRGVLSDIWDALKSFWEYLKGVFAHIKDDISSVFQPLMDLFNKAKEGGEKATKGVNPFKETLEGVKTVIDYISPYVKQFFDMLKENVDFKLPTMSEMGDAVEAGSYATVMFMLANVLGKFFKLFDKGVKLEESIKGVFDTLSKSINTLTGALKDRIKANTFKVLAQGVLEIAAAMFVLALLPQEKLAGAAIAVGGMIGVLAYAFKTISEVKTDRKQLKDIKKLLKAVEEIIAIVVAGIFILATKTNLDEALVATGLIAAMLVEVAGFMKIMESINFTEEQAKTLKKVFNSLAILIAAIGISIAAASKNGDWKSIAASGTVIAGMLFAMAGALRVMPDSENVKALAGALTLLSVAMVLIGAAIAIASSSGDWKSIAASGVVMAGMLFAMAGALKILSGTTDIMKSAAALAVLSVGMLMLGSAIAVLGNLKLEEAAMGVLTMAAALTILLAAGAVAEKISIGLLALGGAIALIGVGVLAAGTGVMMFANGLEKLVNLGTNGTNVFIDGLTKFFENLPMYAANAGDAVVAFIDRIVKAKETIINGFSTVLEALIQALINVSPKIIKLLTVIGKGILQSLTALLPDLFTFLDNLFEQLDAFIVKWVPRIVSTTILIVKELLRSLRELVPDITETLFFILKDTLRQIRDNIEEIISLSVEIGILTVTGFLKGLADQIPNIVETGIDFVLALLNGIADGIESRAEDVRNTMINLVNSLTNAFCTLLGINSPSTVFAGFGDNIVQGLINGIASMIENAKKMITDLANKVLTAICNFFGVDKPQNAQELFQLGKKIIFQFNNAVYGMIEKAKKMITELADKVLTAICDFFGINKPQSKQEFYKLGLNIMNAFKNAISSLTNKVKEAVTGVANAAIDKFKSVLGIHSPSTVFTAFGRFIDLGLANGLDKYAYLAADASESVGESVIDQMGAVMSGLASMIDSDFEDPTIKPVLDLSDVTSGMNALDGMLSTDRSLYMTGSYASQGFNERLEAQNVMTAAFDDLKNALNGKVQNGVTNNNTFNITGDNPREIAQEVSRILQNEVERRDAVWGS